MCEKVSPMGNPTSRGAAPSTLGSHRKVRKGGHIFMQEGMATGGRSSDLRFSKDKGRGKNIVGRRHSAINRTTSEVQGGVERAREDLLAFRGSVGKNASKEALAGYRNTRQLLSGKNRWRTLRGRALTVTLEKCVSNQSLPTFPPTRYAVAPGKSGLKAQRDEREEISTTNNKEY